MRLLRVDNQQFDEVPSHGPFPKYAILSHTWIQPSSEEVSYQDLVSRSPERTTVKAGWSKIQNTIEEARKDGLPYVWIDTCCINKLDPTELTEAINCMYNWYAESACCYVYLSDAEYTGHGTVAAENSSNWLGTSVWFTRGWTLQELVAPLQVKIYDQKWYQATTRQNAAAIISLVTGIPVALLEAPTMITQYSIASRMSWAAGRRTTRAEDRAYSLLGIFGIVMPLHYGEGEEHAFQRLQQEIIRQDADQSILAWEWPASMITSALWSENSRQAPFLAPSPDCFKTRGHVIPARRRQNVAYSISNLGLEIEVCLVVYKELPKASIDTGSESAMSLSKRQTMRMSRSPRARPLQEHDYNFVGAIINCSSTLDSSMIYMLSVDRVADGVFSLATPMDCLEMEWSNVQMHMETLMRPEACWQKITVLRHPQRYGVNMTGPFGQPYLCAKVCVLSYRCPELRLSVHEVWPQQSWNKDTLTFGPIDSPPMDGEVTFSFARNHGDGQAEGFVTIAFNVERGKIAIQASRQPKDLPTLHKHGTIENTEQIVSMVEGSDEFKVHVSAEQIDTPCDAFMLIKVVPMSRKLRVLSPHGESAVFSK